MGVCGRQKTPTQTDSITNNTHSGSEAHTLHRVKFTDIEPARQTGRKTHPHTNTHTQTDVDTADKNDIHNRLRDGPTQLVLTKALYKDYYT